MYIRDLKPEILYNLYNMLDVSGRRNWEQLGMMIGCSQTQMQSYRRLLHCGRSPTDEMLRVWGYKNATVQMLYEALAKMGHGQAQHLLEPYVSSTPHYNKGMESKPLGDMAESSRLWRGPELMPTDRGGGPYSPPSPYSNPSPLMTPDRGMHEAPPSFPHSPGKYSPYGQASHQPSDYSSAYSSTHHGLPPPSPGYMDSTYGQPPGGPPYQPSMPPGPPPPNIEVTKREQRHSGEQAALAATIHKSYEDILQATNNFDEKNKLGEGSFGKVYLAVIGQTKYAVKVLLQNDHVQVAIRNNQRVDQGKELAALVSYKHPNIVLMCFYSVDGKYPCIIYEYLENGSLEDNLLCKGGREPLSWKVRQQIAEGSALGINHLHTANSSTPLIHGDIKSANILLDRHFEPKLGDFGLARAGPLNGKTCTILKTQIAHGTLPYLPEEFKRNLVLSKKVDSFSFGVVLMEILSGERAYDEKREPQRLLSDKVKTETQKDMEGAIALLKDKKCADWPDDLFKEMLVLANRLTSKARQERPEFSMVLTELNKMNARYGLRTSSAVNHPIPTQNSDPLPDPASDVTPDSSTDSSARDKISPEGTASSEETERQEAVNEFRKNCDSMKLEWAASKIKTGVEGGPKVQDGIVGQSGYGGQSEYGGYPGQNGYGRQVGPGYPGHNVHQKEDRDGGGPRAAYMRQNAYMTQKSGGPVGYPGPTSHVQQSSSQFGSDDRCGPGMVGHETFKRFPDNFLAEGRSTGSLHPGGQFERSGRHSPSIRGSPYMEHPPVGTGPPSYNPRPSLPAGPSELEQAFSEGYRRGYQTALEQQLRQEMSLVSLAHRDREIAAQSQYSPQVPNGTRLPSPYIPNHGQGSPMGGGYRFPSDVDRLCPGKGDLAKNKTDEDKITTTGELKQSGCSDGKPFEELQTTEISLQDMRSQKEPQQSTEPM